MFDVTATGYAASDALVALWGARDTCPGCGEVFSPESTLSGTHHYRHANCYGDDVRWTRKA